MMFSYNKISLRIKKDIKIFYLIFIYKSIIEYYIWVNELEYSKNRGRKRAKFSKARNH